MPTNIECLITIEHALQIKRVVGKFVGKCPECKGDVQPLSGDSAHFEHLSGNKDCKLSDHNKRPNVYKDSKT